MKNLILLLTLMLPSIAWAEPPRAVVTGPKTGVPGDIIRLDISKSIGKVFRTYCRPAVFDDGRPTLDEDNPQRPLIASRPGTYVIEVIAANDEGIDRAEFTVIIVGGTNPPPVTPNNPNPPLVTPGNPPTTLEALTAWVDLNCWGLVTADPNRAATAKALAAAYRSWAVAGTASKDATEFAKGQNLLNQIALTQRGQAASWDKFLATLANRLASMNMTTIPEHVKAWGAIALGLEGVK